MKAGIRTGKSTVSIDFSGKGEKFQEETLPRRPREDDKGLEGEGKLLSMAVISKLKEKSSEGRGPSRLQCNSEEKSIRKKCQANICPILQEGRRIVGRGNLKFYKRGENARQRVPPIREQLFF